MSDEVTAWLGGVAAALVVALFKVVSARLARTKARQLSTLRDDSLLEYPSDYPTARPLPPRKRFRDDEDIQRLLDALGDDRNKKRDDADE